MVDVKRLSQLGSSGSDRARLLILGFLLVFVAVAFVVTRRIGSDSAADQVEQQRLLPSEAENAPPAARVDRAVLGEVLDETPEQRLIAEHGPYLHLLMEAGRAVPGDFRRLGSRNLTSEFEDELREDPASHRGEVYSVKGILTSLFERPVSFDLENRDEGTRLPCWVAVAQDSDGHRFSFSTLTEPHNIQVGEVVRLEGFFFKQLDLHVPLGDEAGSDLLVADTLHFVGKHVVPSFLNMEPVYQLDLGLLSTVLDEDLQDRAVIDENVLFHALSFLQNVDADELMTVAKDVTSAALKNRPDEYRGMPIRVLGTFVDTWRRELGPEGENPLGLDFVDHGLLVHSGPAFTYLIAAQPSPPWLERDQNVIVEGIFLQRYVYQSRDGAVQESPLVLVKRFLPYETNVSAVVWFPLIAIFGIAGLFTIWFLISVRGDRAATEEFRKRYYRNKRRQVQERLGKPARG